MRGVFLASPQTGLHLNRQDMETAVSVIDRRLKLLAIPEARVQQAGTNRITIEIPLAGSAGKYISTASTRASFRSI